MTTPLAVLAARGALVALALVLATSCTPPPTTEEPPGSNPVRASDDDALGDAAADTVGVRIRDATTWHRPGADTREVRVTITILGPWQLVVLEPRAEGGGEIEVIEVDSVLVLAPERLRHIEVRPGAGDSPDVVLRVRLPHCERLDYGVYGYLGGLRFELPVFVEHLDSLPDCCNRAVRGRPLPELGPLSNLRMPNPRKNALSGPIPRSWVTCPIRDPWASTTTPQPWANPIAHGGCGAGSNGGRP